MARIVRVFGQPTGRTRPRGAPSAIHTPLQALTGRPATLLLTSWPWRAICYLLTSPIVTAAWLMVAWPLGPLAGVPLGVWERARLALVDTGARPPRAAMPSLRTPSAWFAAHLNDPASWRALAYGVLLVPLSVVDSTIAVTLLSIPVAVAVPPVVRLASGTATAADVVPLLLALLALVIALYLLVAIAGGRGQLARYALLGSRESILDAQVTELTASRSRISTAFESQRRQLERDLHDGAQQRLVSLVMTLGMLRYEMPDDPAPARRLADKAYEEATGALAELRDLVQGIYPATLTEQGIAATLIERAAASPVPVRVQIEDVGRYPAVVESTVYFAVSEALTNAIKHSAAREITVTLARRDRMLVATVTDDGVGGADPARGGGLVGIGDRVGAVLGRVRVHSPVGGPTSVVMEVPCGS